MTLANISGRQLILLGLLALDSVLLFAWASTPAIA
jgi:hypothetical protein